MYTYMYIHRAESGLRVGGARHVRVLRFVGDSGAGLPREVVQPITYSILTYTIKYAVHIVYYTACSK